MPTWSARQVPRERARRDDDLARLPAGPLAGGLLLGSGIRVDPVPRRSRRSSSLRSSSLRSGRSGSGRGTEEHPGVLEGVRAIRRERLLLVLTASMTSLLGMGIVNVAAYPLSIRLDGGTRATARWRRSSAAAGSSAGDRPRADDPGAHPRSSRPRSRGGPGWPWSRRRWWSRSAPSRSPARVAGSARCGDDAHPGRHARRRPQPGLRAQEAAGARRLQRGDGRGRPARRARRRALRRRGGGCEAAGGADRALGGYQTR